MSRAILPDPAHESTQAVVLIVLACLYAARMTRLYAYDPDEADEGTDLVELYCEEAPDFSYFVGLES